MSSSVQTSRSMTSMKRARIARFLPENPDLPNLKKRAKRLVRAHREGEPEALRDIAGFLPRLRSASDQQIAGSPFSLSDAQLVLARQYGFDSWPKLKQHIEAVSREPTRGAMDAAALPDQSEIDADVPLVLPMLPMRDLVAFPGMRVPLFVAREKSLRGVDRALGEGRLMFLATQREMQVTEPQLEGLYEFGTLAYIEQAASVASNATKVLFAVRRRARLEALRGGDHYEARVLALAEDDGSQGDGSLEQEVKRAFERYAESASSVSPELILAAQRSPLPGRLADCVAASVSAEIPDKQAFLACLPPRERLRLVGRWLSERAERAGGAR